MNIKNSARYRPIYNKPFCLRRIDYHIRAWEHYIGDHIYFYCSDDREYFGELVSITGNNLNLSSPNPNTGFLVQASISMNSIESAWVVNEWEQIL